MSKKGNAKGGNGDEMRWRQGEMEMRQGEDETRQR